MILWGPCADPWPSQCKSTMVGEKGWHPGADTVGWLGHARGGANKMQDQSKVILVNAYLSLEGLPYDVLLKFQKLRPPKGSTTGTTLAAQVLSGLVGIPAQTIRRTYYMVKSADWCPSRPRVLFLCHQAGPILLWQSPILIHSPHCSVWGTGFQAPGTFHYHASQFIHVGAPMWS